MKGGFKSLCARIARDERGFVTMTEFLIASALGMIIFFAAISLVTSSANQREKINKRSEAVLNARDGLERMTREARQAQVSASPVSPQVAAGSLVFQRVVAGADPDAALSAQGKEWIRWTCTGTTCTRTSSVAYPPPTTGGQTLVTGLQNSDVFSLAPLVTGASNNFLSVKLDIAPGGSASPRATELQDGVVMRNVP